MKVADSNQTCNPSTPELEMCHVRIAELDNELAKLKQMVQASAKDGLSFDSVERNVRTGVFQLGHMLLELFINLQGRGDIGESVCKEDGKQLHRSKNPSQTHLRSIFGKHAFEEYTYAPGAKKAIELRPVSARMALPERQWSFLLQELSQMLAIDSAYELAMANLGTIFGTRFSVDTAEQINSEMGIAAGKFLADLPLPEAGTEAKLLVATADCKGVPLVKEDAEKVAAFEQSKKRPGNRKMSTVASVYTVEPHVRTAEDIVEALFREEPDEDSCTRKRPKPVNKNTTAHFPETFEDGEENVPISGIHVAMAWITCQVIARRRRGQVMLALMDGQESLWTTLALNFEFGTRTVPILDILHVLTYVWQAAGLFEKDDAKRKAFTRERLLRILRGEASGVIIGLRRLGTTRKLRGESAKTIAKICNYLTKNLDKMKYDEYLRRGYPIASGVIEGACRHLVKDRMERSGMRWTLEGARSMLNMRAAFQSDHWTRFMQDRMEKEIEKTHSNRSLLKDYQPFNLSC